MTFAERLKALRKGAGMSQEQLAEKLNVSRQAITKWETDGGIPDIGNMMAISTLFGVTVDDLLSGEKDAGSPAGALYESVTEYDIDKPKRYDMHLEGARKVVLSGYEGEKLRIRLASNTLATLQSDCKVKIDDGRSSVDVDLHRRNGLTKAAAKEAIAITVQIPSAYMGNIEMAVHADAIELHELACESIELDVKTEQVLLDRVTGTVEINCNQDMDVVCRTLAGKVAINQISAISRIRVPQGAAFATVVKGKGNSVSYEKNGVKTDAFDTQGADAVIELNGMKSELIVAAD